MNDHSRLLILGGVVVVLAPFVLIGIGIASDHRAAHPNKPHKPHKPHNARNIILSLVVVVAASVVFARLSHHSQAPTRAPVRAASATGVPFVPKIFERLPSGTMPVAAKGNKTGPQFAIRAAPTSRAPVSPVLPAASTATTLVPATAAEQSAFKAGQRSCRTRPATSRAPTGAAEQAAFKAGHQWCHSLTTVGRDGPGDKG